MTNTYMVTDGLAQVTLLEKRIQSAIRTAIFDIISFERVSSPRLQAEVEQTVEDIKAGYQSLTKLIETRHAIKAAIIKVNAGVSKDQVLINTVTVLGKEYTAAELIERKKSLVLEKALLNKLKEANLQTERTLEEKTREFERKLEDFIKISVQAQNGKKDDELVAKCTKEFTPGNYSVRKDPLGLVKEIARFELYVNEFESEIDRALSKFNAITPLEV